MKRNIFVLRLLFAVFTLFGFNSLTPAISGALPLLLNKPDTLRENQELYIGKMWSNKYTNVKGDQFLFSREFLPGSLTINGTVYKRILINYDIYNDEILVPKNGESIVQLNKEMVDSFLIINNDITYRFVNARTDSSSVIKGYNNQLYKGKSILYVKYKKEIEELAVDDKYDLFYRTYRIFLQKDGQIYQVTSKNDLLKIMKEDKAKIKDFMKKNRLKVSKKEPGSFIPVIRYYDSISQ
jgi:hypothetical protein